MTRTSRRPARAAPAAPALAALLPALALAATPALAPRSAAAPAAPQEPRALAFPARPGVCGTGDGILMREPDGSTTFISRRPARAGFDPWAPGDPPCETGDVVVRLHRTDGVVTAVDVSVTVSAGAPRTPAQAPARLTGREAAELLLAEARRARDEAGPDLVMAAALADGAVTWPGLLALGRDRSLGRRTRRSAIHWLGRQAAAEAVAALGGIVRDRTEEDGVREAAVFALSRLSEGRGVPLLIEVVRTVPDPRVRRRALFWLAESEDPRALAVFEEILTAGGR